VWLWGRPPWARHLMRAYVLRHPACSSCATQPPACNACHVLLTRWRAVSCVCVCVCVLLQRG
jgi:hypothetical protein